MNFRLFYGVGFVGCAVLSTPVYSSEILSPDVTLFHVKPKVCIVEKAGQACEFDAQVQWQTTKPMDICLTQGVAKTEQVLQCWVNEQYVYQIMPVVYKHTTTMRLVDSAQQTLAQEVLQVNAVQPKKQRRRLRSAWSLF